MKKPFYCGLAFLGLLIIFLIDYPALNCPFIYDDLAVIVFNPEIHSGSLAQALYFNPFRSVAYFSFWLQFQIGGILAQPIGFRIMNLILHWLTGLVLIRLAMLLKPGEAYLPALCAIFFWTNPIFLEAINLIVGRTEILLTLFYMMALYFHLKQTRSWLSMLGFFISYLLALFSKETAITLPVAVLLLSFYQRESVPWGKLLLATIIGLVYFIFRINWTIILAKSAGELSPWLDYFLAQNWIIWLASLKTIFPLQLNFDYQLGNYFLLGILFLLINLALIFLVLYRNKRGWLGLIYLLLYLPLMLVPLADLLRESRLYLSSAWLILILSLLLAPLLRQRRKIIWFKLFLIIIGFILLGHFRARVYESGETLWRDAVKKSPHKFRPVFNYANALRRKLELDKAQRAYLWAKQIEPENLEVERNLYLIEQAQKFSQSPETIKELIQENQ